ncbi:hypothetical protein [Streptomyces sp. NBC_00503]|nr:hypothetical protein [Streptomyces sp. NBC_00503]WUD79766.1 hypothetical protein OG490_03795 [Streptomyces sp. NBC_00503]
MASDLLARVFPSLRHEAQTTALQHHRDRLSEDANLLIRARLNS